MTDTQAAYVVSGMLVGSTFAIITTLGIILYVLLVIAQWKIFTKAGEPGWKSLIPIYNIYVFCKIIRVSFWIWCLLIPIGLGVVSAIINNTTVTTIMSGVYAFVFEILYAVKLAKAFNKGVGFIIGLILLPNIFYLILGFGNSKYALNAE